MRGVTKQQLTYESIGKYASLSADEVKAFVKGEKELPFEEIGKLNILLLMIDKELNYEPRRNYSFAPGEVIEVLDD